MKEAVRQEAMKRLLAQSRLPTPTLPFPDFLRRKLPFGREYRALVRDYEAISHCPLFDPTWYVSEYKNVEENGEDPIYHFLKFGCEYSLSPGPYFDTKAYLADHPKVKDRGENPLLHYIRKNIEKRGFRDRLPFFSRRRGTVEGAAHYVTWISQCEIADRWASGQTGPSVSFLVVTRRGADAALADTLSSLDALRGLDWDALVATNGLADTATLTERVAPVAVECDDRGAILATLLGSVTGEFFVVLDAGDRVSPHALQEFWQHALNRPDLDLVYSDEDLAAGSGRDKPFLKPAWSPEYLDSFNYFGRLTFVRTSLALSCGSFSDAYGDAAEYDLNLRVCDRTQNIGRIPKILCHRSPDVVGDRPTAESAAATDQRRVMTARWARHGIAATVAAQPNGTLRSTWPLVDPPLVSVVIPTKNKRELLKVTLEGLLEQTDYPRLEIIIVDNLSTDPALAALYAKVETQGSVRIVSFTEPFNYSAACNVGARAANGSVLLFLNNDIEVTTADWLEELVRCVGQPAVGVAGTMLVYPDGELQHAGVVAGMHGCYGMIFRAAELHGWGVFGSPSVPRNYLGIMGACQMIRRDVFDAVGGFDTTYQIANSDIALSIAAWRLGYRTVYTPFAKLVHHEGASRGHTNPTEDYARTIRDLDAFGILEDPFFHPALSSMAAIPTLCIDPEVSTVEQLARARADHLSTYGDPSRIDLFDTADVILALGRDIALHAFWDPQPASAVSDEWSAMRFIIDLIRREPDLRARFPHALSNGGAGDFALWLASDDGRLRLDLSAAAIAAIRRAFASAPGDPVRRAYLLDDDVRTKMPLGCTPAGLRDLFVWLVSHGRIENELRIEAIWWFALECIEKPALELVRAYLFNPAWQRTFPDGLTVFSRRDFARWLEVLHRLDDDWLDPVHWPVRLSPAEHVRLAYHRREFWRQRHPAAFGSENDALSLLEWLAKNDESGVTEEARAWLRALDMPKVAADLARTGANILGHFCYPSGLRTSAESIVKGLREVGSGTSLRDVWVDRKDDPNHVSFDGLEAYDTTIIHTQPEPFFSQSYQRCGLFERKPRTYRIAYWYWEQDDIPEIWLEKADEIDEIWVATRFVGDAARARFDKPVHEVLPGLELPEFAPLPRCHFGLDESRFTFLFVFHMTSIMERKNPLGLIRAFRLAFGDGPRPRLVIKTSFGSKHLELLRQMHDAAAGDGIEIIDAIYSPQETLSIMTACDCYVSLHRSEGYGLTMAEAMLLGKPVIATAYSGNLDFMDANNSLLVERGIVTLEREYPPYAAGSRWAEPSIDHAAMCMRRVYEDQAWGKSLGARARADLAVRLSYAASGARMAARLAEIDRMRREDREPLPIRARLDR